MAIARSGWCCLWVSPRYRIEDDRVTLSRSPLAWPMLGLLVVGLLVAYIYGQRSYLYFWDMWWGLAVAGVGLFGAVSATWFPRRVVITRDAVVWGYQRYPRAEIKSVNGDSGTFSTRGHLGGYNVMYLDVELVSGKRLMMQLARTQFLVESTSATVNEVIRAARGILLGPPAHAQPAPAAKPAPAPAPTAPVPGSIAPAPASAPAPAPARVAAAAAPALLPDDVAAFAVGSRVYRVRRGFVDFHADVLAFDDGSQVGSATVSLPHYFQIANATLAVRNADIVITLVAFHCKDDSGFEGTWVVDAACKTQSTSWN